MYMCRHVSSFCVYIRSTCICVCMSENSMCHVSPMCSRRRCFCNMSQQEWYDHIQRCTCTGEDTDETILFEIPPEKSWLILRSNAESRKSKDENRQRHHAGKFIEQGHWDWMDVFELDAKKFDRPVLMASPEDHLLIWHHAKALNMNFGEWIVKKGTKGIGAAGNNGVADFPYIDGLRFYLWRCGVPFHIRMMASFPQNLVGRLELRMFVDFHCPHHHFVLAQAMCPETVLIVGCHFGARYWLNRLPSAKDWLSDMLRDTYAVRHEPVSVSLLQRSPSFQPWWCDQDLMACSSNWWYSSAHQ